MIGLPNTCLVRQADCLAFCVWQLRLNSAWDKRFRAMSGAHYTHPLDESFALRGKSKAKAKQKQSPNSLPRPPPGAWLGKILSRDSACPTL